MSSKAVLIVDDETAIQKLLSAFLTSRGWACVTVGDPAGARVHLDRNDLTHAMVDLHLGAHSGYDLIREISGRRPDVRLVAMTGSMLAGRDAAREAGASQFLTKPFASLGEVLTALESPA